MSFAIIISSSLHHDISEVITKTITGMHSPVARKSQNAEPLAASEALQSQMSDLCLECEISPHSWKILLPSLLLFQARESTSLFCSPSYILPPHCQYLSPHNLMKWLKH